MKSSVWVIMESFLLFLPVRVMWLDSCTIDVMIIFIYCSWNLKIEV
uniref:Uncharacterized protein n=1 Tax=Rhizophora mucronata TaxID=61149 RepID=A0A2P2R2P5_RHIMU